MERGRLRVFFGAGAGVGKTFAMVEEGRRQRMEGRDVVVAAVDPHGREDVIALLSDLEVVGPGSHDDAEAGFDLAAVLARRPQVALVDELAKGNPPGSRHQTRWQDIEELLEAGVDVLSTLNVQNLESLNDVVFEITGVREEETIADGVVRRIADIELVDLTEEGVRERLRAGKIYPAEDINAALANYFRLGNLTALRELALSWTAEGVDEKLADYRSTHGIDQTWQTKERILVGLAGVPGAEVMIRRAARMASRSRAELLGVHIRSSIRSTDTDRRCLEEQRRLLERLGGEYHELAGDDVPDALLTFARSENATQVVLGASRRSSLRAWLGASPVARVIRGSESLDVHVISYEATRRRRPRRIRRPGFLGLTRRLAAWLVAAVGLPLLTVVLLRFRDQVALENVLLVYLLAAVGVGVVGGALPAVLSAGVGFLLANWYFAPPFLTWKIDDASHLFSLFAFLLVASAVGLLVGNATRRSAEARKARSQAEALAATATADLPLLGTVASGMTRRIRDVFSMNAAAVLRRSDDGWEALANVGASQLLRPEDATDVIPLTEGTVLAINGDTLTGDDRRVLRAFAAQMAQALEREKLEREAADVKALAETDRLRTALLNAVSHDLRTPLATIMASVTSLLETGVTWSADQTGAFLRTILEETETLNRVVGRLLDASRVQVGAVHVFIVPVGLDEVIAASLAGLGARADRVELVLPDELPPVLTDPALLERVVANLVENAITWSPEDHSVRVTAGVVSGRVDLRIVDRGPGIPLDAREAIFQPFQRLGDSSRGGGVGLGMAVARGFLEAMGNELVIEDTPAGGTTMVIGFMVAAPAEGLSGALGGTPYE